MAVILSYNMADLATYHENAMRSSVEARANASGLDSFYRRA